ncbi:TPA: hypothetical protein SK269_001804 [Yersinia enterocolitica]|nr:hypothetical protein [Yersinia enterocolitica]HEI6777422.1 hypothetical protein [Yersinia enterocolitica]HEI6838333.1 hypothetical protein [Yersinia enterocolitica]HEI6876150.1 hypothetical protein [Yersinia enterocolitica]HEI6912809.1 hypothetical protein [Yersinia enterocolitica]
MNIEDVFGVSGKQIETYIARDSVDNRFIDAINTDKQIIIYGASKQGKSALVAKYIPDEQHILVTLSPKTTLKDIYQSILRKCGVTLKTTYTEGTGDTSKFRAKAKIEATVAMILKTSIDAGAESSTTKKIEENYDEIEFNLELPDDVADLIKRTGNKKSIILENFHYLPEDIQRTFAFDLRSFQDLKVKFKVFGKKPIDFRNLMGNYKIEYLKFQLNHGLKKISER